MPPIRTNRERPLRDVAHGSATKIKVVHRVLLAGAALAAGLIGCESGTGWVAHAQRPAIAERPGGSAEVNVVRAPSASSSVAHRASPPLGLPGIFFRAARATGLSQEAAATIASLEGQLASAYELPNAATRAFQSDLAASIRNRAIDTARLRADQDRFAQCLHALTESQSHAFQALHDALSDEQRRSVADTIRASMNRSEQATQQLRERQSREPQPDLAAKVARRLGQMKEQLGLSGDQEQLIEPILFKMEPSRAPNEAALRDQAAKKQMHDLLTAFELPVFDPAKVDLSPISDDPVHALEREVQLMAAVVPLLNQDQIQRLASAVAPGMSGAPAL